MTNVLLQANSQKEAERERYWHILLPPLQKLTKVVAIISDKTDDDNVCRNCRIALFFRLRHGSRVCFTPDQMEMSWDWCKQPFSSPSKMTLLTPVLRKNMSRLVWQSWHLSFFLWHWGSAGIETNPPCDDSCFINQLVAKTSNLTVEDHTKDEPCFRGNLTNTNGGLMNIFNLPLWLWLWAKASSKQMVVRPLKY